MPRAVFCILFSRPWPARAVLQLRARAQGSAEELPDFAGEGVEPSFLPFSLLSSQTCLLCLAGPGPPTVRALLSPGTSPQHAATQLDVIRFSLGKSSPVPKPKTTTVLGYQRLAEPRSRNTPRSALLCRPAVQSERPQARHTITLSAATRELK